MWYGQGREVCEALREHKVGGGEPRGVRGDSLRKVTGTSRGKDSRQRELCGGQPGEQ